MSNIWVFLYCNYQLSFDIPVNMFDWVEKRAKHSKPQVQRINQEKYIYKIRTHKQVLCSTAVILLRQDVEIAKHCGDEESEAMALGVIA